MRQTIHPEKLHGVLLEMLLEAGVEIRRVGLQQAQKLLPPSGGKLPGHPLRDLHKAVGSALLDFRATLGQPGF